MARARSSLTTALTLGRSHLALRTGQIVEGTCGCLKADDNWALGITLHELVTANMPNGPAHPFDYHDESIERVHVNIIMYSYACLLYTSPSPRDS